MVGELVFLLRSLLFGFGLGGVYSLLSVLRMLFGVRYPRESGGWQGVSLPLLGDKTAKRFLKGKREGAIFLPVFVGDLVFFVFFALGYSVFLYAFHSGILRLYSLLGVLVGFFLWKITLGRLVLRFSAYILFCLYALWDYADHFLFCPVFRAIGRLLRLLWRWERKFLCLCGKILFMGVYTLYSPLYLLYQRRKLQKMLKGILAYEKNKG